ncbi:putative baseplate assembly protein [Rhodobacteraceae bacterium B1Z28]|uniref:Baseplate assembly protein n=1 Tax=Ruegeria haliotis TaxID=2747601 RepID=A0ABX2PVQ4_9RHOB|nr:putative baseplate assembly protein [Ruegeria haliotis]NVO58260.1 putative baseplate assembly protein [Ruegeria haliotis]
MIYHCCDPRRRELVLEAIADGVAINGIDFLEVLDREADDDTPAQQTLLLRFLDTAPNLPLDNYQLSGGERITGVTIDWQTRADAPDATLAEPGLLGYLATLTDPGQVIVLRTSSNGDFSTYTLRLVAGPGLLSPPNGIDRILSEIDFSFKVECPTDFDCKPQHICADDLPDPPVLSYLAKDYTSFRRLMLGRMAQIMPDWRDRSPADLGITLVEMLSYSADRLSYAQDAVATESYISTARRRSSVRCHAKLVDYHMHDGANARVWIHVDVDADTTISESTQFLTRLIGFDPTISGTTEERDARNLEPLVFENFAEKEMFENLNEMPFYEWGDADCCLPKGATRATLAGDRAELLVGDVLIFEERLGPNTGRAADADPSVRHAVQLSAIEAGETDALTGASITEIRWAEEDALPFPFCISSQLGQLREVSHALGNNILADHGETIADEDLGEVPAPHLYLVPDETDNPCHHPEPRAVPPRFRPVLSQRPVTQSAPFTETTSALAATQVGVATRRAHVALVSGVAPDDDDWAARRDLLQSFADDPHFVVEVESDGLARLRFGDDANGKRPNSATAFVATYRVGNGTAGNVGRDAIRHAFSGLGTIRAIRNPLPATGGREPESIEEVRQAAPYAYRRQERAVTAEDYAEVARRHPDVQRAAATFRWNGHGHTVFVTVDRFGGRPITEEFETELRAHLEGFRMAGYDLEVDGPRFVALELELLICAGRDHFRSDIRLAAFEALSANILSDGSKGLFHPDNFTFGQPVYLSAISARLMQIEGIESVETTVFRRRGSTDQTPLMDGILTFGRLEIAQLENDPNFPERGAIAIEMGGGK